MEVQFGPNSADEPNLLYKQQCKRKVFHTEETLPNRSYNLVASSSKYALVFVAVPNGSLSVYHLNQLIDKECDPPHMTVNLPEKPTHVSVSCDYELLAVTGGNGLWIYKVTDFQNPNVSPAISIKCEVNSSTYVLAISWNPCIPDSIVLLFSDGTLMACQAATGQVKKVPSKARCLCWSPKGKQFVTGNNDGTLFQYKPDLTPAKAIPAPNLFQGSPVEAMAIYWISTYQFAVVYKNAADNSRPSVTIVNTPKGGQPTCLNYEDICYSMGSNRPWYYYLQSVAQWNIILSASSNSMELATIGSTDGANWLQWCQPDEARPELPLTDKKQENYPVGVCLDPCAIHQLPWGENDTLPYMPLLHVVSQTGLLTIFNLINLTKDAPQVCSPPQQLVLPANALTSDVPGEAPKTEEAIAPAPVETKPQTIAPVMPAVQPVQFSAPPAQSVLAAAPIKIPSFQPSAISIPQPTSTQIPNQKAATENSASVAQSQTTLTQPKPSQPGPVKQAPTQPPENAALKAEQEKINKQKANEELKNMLVKEVNDFQDELYNFMVKTRETQARIQRDIESINSNFNFNSLDTEQLKKECSIDELRNAIVQLKLELVRACAVIAEARTHSNAKEYHQWTQADPLTTKRVASVKKLAYYVETQLDQAQKALDYKWSELVSKGSDNMPGKRMIRPILDDVYQPLVKQQEILSRQQAVLRTLKKALKECDVGPVFKSTSLLRSTPFRNKDPLSKLTKNILNMSIEPRTEKQKGLLTSQKLEALRDALSNHKTTKIKPVNVELRQHFVTMKENYERCVREKMVQAQAILALQAKNEPIVQPQVPKLQNVAPQPPMQVKIELKPVIKQEPMKQEPMKQEPLKHAISAPSFTPLSNMKPAPGLANVARTLFTDEPKQELPKSMPQQPTKPFSFASQAPASSATKSVLKDLLQTKSQASLDAKSDSNNLFMGQKICSPTGISQSRKQLTAVKKRFSNTSDISSVPGSSAPTSISSPSAVIFTSKPISEMNNMFNKLPTTFDTKPAVDAKPVAVEPKPTAIEVKSATKIHSETGEPNSTTDPPKSIELKPNKPMTNLFGLKPTATSTPVPDIVKTSLQTDKNTAKPLDKTDNSKENVPKVDDAKNTDKVVKPLGTANKGSILGAVNNSIASSEPKSSELKAVSKATEPVTEKTEAKVTTTEVKVTTDDKVSSSTSVSKPEITPSATPSKTETSTPKSESEKSSASASSSASSIFGAAVASQPKTDSISSSQSSTSIFASTTPSSAFGAKPSTFGTSVFGAAPTATTQSVITSTSATVFATADTPVTTIFSAVSKSEETAPTTASGINFGTTSSSSNTTPSVFGQASGAFAPTTTSLFATTTSTSFSPTVFGTQTSTSTSPSASSVFGSAASQAFGSSSQAQPPSPSVFGAQVTQASVFATPTQTTQASLFGTPTQTTQASLFGTPAQTTQASVFGTPTQTTQASVFGTPPPSTQPSLFGTPTQTTQASVFGTPPQPTQASVFGTPPPSTQPSLFGTPTQTTQATVFGTPTQTGQASVFGTPPPSTQASLFGTPPQTTQASVFGSTAANSGSLFGGAEANLFSSASISATSAPTAGSGGNIFGGSSTGSVFGGGTNAFGGKSTFGQSNNTATSIFGGAPSFGQKPATNLWGSGTGSSGGFGSSGFGQATTQASSIFGGGAGGSFSAPSAGAFGSPQQTPAFGTGESQPASVFGTQQQQSGSAFGGSPVFGSKPAFGQPAGFGSPPSGGGFGGFGGGFNKTASGFGAPASFGGAATFGGNAFGNTSPGKVFGGGAANAGFGSPNQQSNATFENLATQNTLTFGNLAQQTPQQSQQPSFNTSPSFTSWRG